MPKTLNEFYSRLINQGVKLQHQFQLQIVGSPNGTVDRLLEDVTMWAQGVDVPGRTQNTADIPYLGYAFNVATNFTMTNTLELTINCSQDMGIRDALLFWKGLISDSNIEGGASGGGIKTASNAKGILELYNQTMDTPTHIYELIGLYPTEVGNATMSNADPGIVTFPITFKYQYWKLSQQPNFS